MSMNPDRYTGLEVVFSLGSFRDMILFSGRFANNSIERDNWKEVYGFLVGKVIKKDEKDILYISRLIPMIHGSSTEVYFTEQDYVISEKIMDEVQKAGLFVCGWYHTHPGLDLFLSDTDIYNQLGFQSVFPSAVAFVFDFTKITNEFNGFRAYRLNDVNLGVSSTYSEIQYHIETPQETNKVFMAKSFLDVAASYEKSQPFIKEAKEVLDESGNFSNLFEEEETVDQSEEHSVERDTSEIEVGTLQEQIKNVESDLESDLQQSKKNVDYDGEIESYTGEGSGYYELLEKYSEANWEIRGFRKQIEELKNESKSVGFLQIKLAIKLIEHSKRSEALGELEAAESEFKSSDNQLGLATVYNELGLYYEDEGSIEMSLNYFEGSVNILENMKENNKIVQVLNNIGNVYLKNNEYDTAFSYFKRAYNSANSIGYTLGMVASLNNAVDVLLFLQNYQLVYRVLTKNFKYFSSTNNDYGIGLTLSKFGRLYFTQGPRFYRLSEDYFRKAIEIKKRASLLRETTEDWIFLSKIYADKKDYNTAIVCLTQGLNIIRTYDIQSEEGKFYLLLAELYVKMGNIGDARDYYKMSIENYEDFGDDQKVAEINEELSQLYKNFYGEYEDALTPLYEALKIYKSQNYSKKIADTLIKIADIRILLNEIDDAKECLLEARMLYLSFYDEYDVKVIDEKLKSL